MKRILIFPLLASLCTVSALAQSADSVKVAADSLKAAADTMAVVVAEAADTVSVAAESTGVVSKTTNIIDIVLIALFVGIAIFTIFRKGPRHTKAQPIKVDKPKKLGKLKDDSKLKRFRNLYIKKDKGCYCTIGYAKVERQHVDAYIDRLIAEYYRFGDDDGKLRAFITSWASDDKPTVTLRVPYVLKDSDEMEEGWARLPKAKFPVFYMPVPEFILDVPTDEPAPEGGNGSAPAGGTLPPLEGEDLFGQIAQGLAQLKTQMGEGAADCEALFAQLDTLVADAKDGSEGLRTALKSAHEQIEALNAQYRAEKQAHEETKGKLKELEDGFKKKVQQEVAKVQQELDDTKAALRQTKEELAATAAELTATAAALKKLEAQHKQLQRELEQAKQDKQRAVDDLDKQKKAHAAAEEKLKKEHTAAENRLKQEHAEAEAKLNQAHAAAVERLKKDHEEAVRRYKNLFTFYPGCEEFSRPAAELFALIEQLHQGQVALSSKVQAKSSLSDEDKDNFNYYLTSVVNKYYKAVEGLPLTAFEQEFAVLNTTGMALTGKQIDQILEKSAADDYVKNLRYRTYKPLFAPLCGAAIVLSDDLLSLPRLCPAAVSEAEVKSFSQLTEQLLKTTRQLGYQPVYVKLFTPYSDYADISVEKSVNLEGTRKNDVVEVLQMAINYNDSKLQTKVSANI